MSLTAGLGFVNGPIRECASLVPELNQFIPTVNAGTATEVHALSAPEVIASFLMPNGSIERSKRVTIHVQDIQYRVTADTFFQANRFLLAPFINEVVEQRRARQRSGTVFRRWLLFDPPGAGGQEVIAIESDRAAVRQARETAEANKTWSIRFVEGQVDATIRDVRPEAGSGGPRSAARRMRGEDR